MCTCITYFRKKPVIQIISACIGINAQFFSFVDKSQTTIFDIVSRAFADPVYVVIYVLVMIVAAVHVSHGFWSAFQTIGANRPKYMPALRLLSIVLAVIIGAGFGFLPIFIAISA